MGTMRHWSSVAFSQPALAAKVDNMVSKIRWGMHFDSPTETGRRINCLLQFEILVRNRRSLVISLPALLRRRLRAGSAQSKTIRASPFQAARSN